MCPLFISQFYFCCPTVLLFSELYEMITHIRPSLRSCLSQAAEIQFTRERRNVLTAKATGHFSGLIPPNLKFDLLAPT